MSQVSLRDKKIAILVNQIAPYKAPIYREIARTFDTRIFVSGTESNRPGWDDYSLLDEPFRVKKAWGYTLKLKKKINGSFFDYKFLHLNPGYLVDLLKFHPDAVISTEMGFRSIAAVLYGITFRKSVWVWWGGTLHTEQAVGAVKRTVRAVFARVVRRWISYGETSTEYLMSIGVPRGRILQIQGAADEALFSKPVAPAFDVHPKPVLLFVGQMIDRKGLKPLLMAASALQRDGYVFSLLLVGGGPMLEAYKRLAHQLGLADTTFHPAVKPDEMPAVYRSADCLVFPTLEDIWGLVANEALLSGIPVLSSVYAGCAKELFPREYQFDPLDAEDFGKALKLFLDKKRGYQNPAALLPIGEVAWMIVRDIGETITSFSGKGEGCEEGWR
jgi:glycosyltransferase involved in cell wall biosynthesis